MLLKIKCQKEIIVPKGTKVITNDSWLTLAKKNQSGNVDVITIHVSNIGSIDFMNENNWSEFRKEEFKKVLAQF
jgi:hypothetical protein